MEINCVTPVMVNCKHVMYEETNHPLIFADNELENRYIVHDPKVHDLNLYGVEPTKKLFHAAPEFWPSNNTLF